MEVSGCIMGYYITADGRILAAVFGIDRGNLFPYSSLFLSNGMEDDAMYAVVRTGGKQLRVSPGDVIQVEKLLVEPGETVELTEVLMVSTEQGTTVGTPTVGGAAVVCKAVRNGKGRKILIYKYKRRKGFARKQGHRQPFTMLSVTEIRVA